MSRKYYAWKDPACGGINIEWVELTGKEFHAMIKLEENKNRRFVRLGNNICPDADVIVIEATESEYTAWRREQNAADYRSRQKRGTTVISLDHNTEQSEVHSLHEMVPDQHVDVERAALSHIAHKKLEQCFSILTDDDVRLLMEIYVQKKTAAEIARDLQVNRSTISRRLSGILKNLKKFF